MGQPYSSMTATDVVETYFIDNRARLLEIASFLDRVDRYPNPAAAKTDFRYQAFMKALKLMGEADRNRTEQLQLLFSDHSTEPIESAAGLKAYGASKEACHESD